MWVGLIQSIDSTNCKIWAFLGFPGGDIGKEPACNAGDVRDMGSIPGSGRSPRGGHGNPLQYSCLENPMDRGIHRVTKSWTWLKWLSTELSWRRNSASRLQNWDFPGGPVVKNLPSNAGDMGSIPGGGTNIPHAKGQLNPWAETKTWFSQINKYWKKIKTAESSSAWVDSLPTDLPAPTIVWAYLCVCTHMRKLMIREIK